MKGVELYGRVRHAVRIEGLSRREDESAVSAAFWEMALHHGELRTQFHIKYRRWRNYLTRELEELLPQLDAEQISSRVDLAVAMADGLLVTFSLEGKRYPAAKKLKIVDEMVSLLGLTS